MADSFVALLDKLERAHVAGDTETVHRTFAALTGPLLLRGAVVPGTAFHHAGKSYWLVQRGDTLGLSICEDGFEPQQTPVSLYALFMSRAEN